LLKEGSKSDKVEARKLADLLRTGMLRPHLPEGRGEAFSLDILFHRMSVMAILKSVARTPANRHQVTVVTSSTTLATPANRRTCQSNDL